jgi:hypothetical protein
VQHEHRRDDIEGGMITLPPSQKHAIILPKLPRGLFAPVHSSVGLRLRPATQKVAGLKQSRTAYDNCANAHRDDQTSRIVMNSRSFFSLVAARGEWGFPRFKFKLFSFPFQRFSRVRVGGTICGRFYPWDLLKLVPIQTIHVGQDKTGQDKTRTTNWPVGRR